MVEEQNYRLVDRFLKEEEFSEEVNAVRALDTATGEYALIKRWKNSEAAGVNEIKQRSLMHHKNITDFICSFSENDFRFMVCRWADGIGLDEYVFEDGKLHENDALAVFTEICSVLEYFACIEGGPVVHGDLKPENIIIRRNKTETEKKFSVHIIDFETCVKIGEEGRKTLEHFSTLPAGSYFFSAPETLMGKSCENSDMYSAGAVLGFMLFGKTFYEDTEKCMKSTMKSVKILKECMISDPSKRKITPESAGKAAEMIIRTGDTGGKEKINQEKYKEETKNNEQVPVVKTKIHFAEKLSVSVDNNLCFATELAYACAELYGMKTLLVDSFTGKNRVSAYMLGEMVQEEKCFYGMNGIEAMLRYRPESWYERGLIGKTENDTELYVGTKTLGEELFYTSEEIEEFYGWAYKNFDAVVMNVYRNTADKIRKEIFSLFNYVIVAEEPNIDLMESACEYYDAENVRYVAWDYKKEKSLPKGGIECLTGKENYLGSISYNDERYRMRNTLKKPEFFGKKADAVEEYREILEKMLFGGRK